MTFWTWTPKEKLASCQHSISTGWYCNSCLRNRDGRGCEQLNRCWQVPLLHCQCNKTQQDPGILLVWFRGLTGCKICSTANRHWKLGCWRFSFPQLLWLDGRGYMGNRSWPDCLKQITPKINEKTSISISFGSGPRIDYSMSVPNLGN